MNIDVHCECDLCSYYKDGTCTADMGIVIDNTGECETYEMKEMEPEEI